MKLKYRSGSAGLVFLIASAMAVSQASSTERHVAAGLAHSLATKADGTVWAWGNNDSGQLGDNTFVSTTAPVQAGAFTDAKAVAAGLYHSMALRGNGTVWAWGYNADGVLGDGTNVDAGAPVQAGTISTAISIGAGDLHSLAVLANGTVWAWGSNSTGQLGDGTTTDSSSPVQVGGSFTGAIAAAGGRAHSLALKADGTVWAWGYNSYGTLGDGTNVDSYTPVQVTGLTNAVEVAAGAYHSVALKSDGTVWTWGENYYGPLGDGTNTGSWTPVQVVTASGNLTGVVSIAAADNYTLAVRSDGTVWAWGTNFIGQLGNGTTTDSNVAVQVTGLTNAIEAAGLTYHSLALLADGTAKAWGYNGYGALGTGNTTDSLVPVSVTGFTNGGSYVEAKWWADNTNPVAKSLFASYNFTPVVVGGSLSYSRVNDITGNARHATARYLSKVTANVLTDPWNGISGEGFGSDNLHHFSIDAKSPILDYRTVKSLSFWVRLGSGQLTGEQPIFTYVPYSALRSATSSTINPYAIRALLRPTVGGGTELIFRSWALESVSIRERWTLDRTPAQLENRWVNITFVWRGSTTGWNAYVDGRVQTRNIGSLMHFLYNPSAQDTFIVGAQANNGSGAVPLLSHSFAGDFDRVRLYTGELTAGETATIRQQDTDGDGLWDATEGPLGAARGYTWDSSLTDTDGDGFTDLQEQTAETDPGAP